VEETTEHTHLPRAADAQIASRTRHPPPGTPGSAPNIASALPAPSCAGLSGAEGVHMQTTNTIRRMPRSPERPVVLRDQSAGLRYLSLSNRPTDLSTTWKDGRVYPVIEVDLSSEHRPEPLPELV
jgi:large subunit ribosomal protein L31